MNFFVVLHRSPHKPDLKYGPESEHTARNRVMALADLHSCRWTQDNETFHVWAADWYKPRKPE